MENNNSAPARSLAPKSKVYHSPVSGPLTVKWEKNKKILDTMHTNYSYGSLEDVLNFGLDFIPLEGVRSALLLGMGGGCVIGSLRNRYQCDAPVTAVEIDPVVIEIAAEEFGLVPMADIEIVEGDAYLYIADATQTYDLIIVDIFIDLTVPEKFYEADFWKNIADQLNLGGFVLFNAGIDLDEEETMAFLDQLPDNLVYSVKFNVFESNTLIILNKFSDA